MKLNGDDRIDLTYCTNIHAGDGWEEVFANIQRYGPALKRRLSPQAPFGLGLRLSAGECEQLRAGDRLRKFKEYLEENGLYVALINGFPYGSFHQQAIKDEVFAPDWQREERVDYSLGLIEILKELLPPGQDGGISTLPLSYKRWIADDCAWGTITKNLIRVAEALIRARRDEGRLIHLDIEPEPDGLVENSAEVVAFYRNWLLPVGAPLLADALKIPVDEARNYLLDHLRVCLDTCHFAVEYEDPVAALERFEQVGIGIGRVQVSSALKVMLPDGDRNRQQLARQLEPFSESTYLHQVIECGDGGGMRHYPDLVDALPMIQDPQAKEWRIHFHVPLFTGQVGMFNTTQRYIKTVFELLKQNRFTRHLEIETYTWEVLPPELKQDLLESIEREYRWVLGEFER